MDSKTIKMITNSTLKTTDTSSPLPKLLIRAVIITISLFLTTSIGKSQDTTRLYYDTGELLGKGFLEKGKIIGKWIFYYESGKKYSEGEYLNYYMNGLWSYYNENGNLEMQEYSDKGLVRWKKFYHENGQLESYGPTVMLSTKSFW